MLRKDAVEAAEITHGFVQSYLYCMIFHVLQCHSP
jgi:hypothetical protein